MKKVTYFNGFHNETEIGVLKKTGEFRYTLTTQYGLEIDLHKNDIVWKRDQNVADKFLKLQSEEFELEDWLRMNHRYDVGKVIYDAKEKQLDKIQPKLHSMMNRDVICEKIFNQLGDQCCSYDEFVE